MPCNWTRRPITHQTNKFSQNWTEAHRAKIPVRFIYHQVSLEVIDSFVRFFNGQNNKVITGNIEHETITYFVFFRRICFVLQREDSVLSNAKTQLWLMDWWIDWLTHWLINWLTDRFAGCLIDWLVDWLIDWLTAWLIDWLIDWLNDWLIDWLIDWLTDRLIDSLIIDYSLLFSIFTVWF